MSNGEHTSESIEPFLSTSLKQVVGLDRGWGEYRTSSGAV